MTPAAVLTTMMISWGIARLGDASPESNGSLGTSVSQPKAALTPVTRLMSQPGPVKPSLHTHWPLMQSPPAVQLGQANVAQAAPLSGQGPRTPFR